MSEGGCTIAECQTYEPDSSQGDQPVSNPVKISREDETTHGAYRVEVPGAERPAVLTWRVSQNAHKNPLHQSPQHVKVRIAEHTFVPSEARGQGIAMKLVEALIEDARAQNFTVDPQCSYVAAAFRRNPEWADLRAK